MTFRLPMICDSCIQQSATGDTCTAYPEGITLDPLGAELHDAPRPDQNNTVVYEQAPDGAFNREVFDKFRDALLNPSP